VNTVRGEIWEVKEGWVLTEGRSEVSGSKWKRCGRWVEHCALLRCAQTSESTPSGERLTEMTEGGLVLDAGSYLDVNGPLAQMAKSQP
jgi:hypothetical protein